MDQEHEEVESIPWSELLPQETDARRRMVYLAAGAIGALVLGILVARAFMSPSEAVVPVAPTVETVATTTSSSTTTIATTTTLALQGPLPTIPVPAPLYSEADLMAFPTGTEERTAVARAEWFVTDYFTADLEPNGSADVLVALPAGVDLPELPQDAASALSYVEWARAFRVEEADLGVYRVGVVFRTLGAPPDRGFYRLPVRAVEVTVAVSSDGGSVVVDLPTPVALPAAPEPDPWPTAGGEPPAKVLEEAIAAAAGWGTEPRLVVAQRVQGRWRVVLTLADEVGNRWPVTIMVDRTGD